MRRLLTVILVLLMSASASALELVRQKNVATYIVFPLVDSATPTALQSGATSPDSEIDAWADGSAPDGFTDCANEATEIGTTGQYYLSLSADEMNTDYVIIQIKASDAITQTILIRTMVGDPLLVGTTTSGRLIVTDAAGLVDANTVKVGPTGSGTAQTARDLGASVLLSPGTGTGQVSLSSGAVTVGTNNDKTGYTASTVSDKTGYSLAASQHVIVDSGTVTTLTNAPSDSSGVTTLLSRIVGTLASGTHNPQTGDAYAVVNSGTYGNSALKTLIDNVDNYVDTEVAIIISTLGTAGAGLTALGDARLANLDATVSSRSTFAAGTDAVITLTDVSNIRDEMDAALDATIIRANVMQVVSTDLDSYSAFLADFLVALTGGSHTIAVNASHQVTYSNTAPLDAAGIRSAIGMAAADLDEQIAGIEGGSSDPGAVWDEPLADHTEAGSAGFALAAAGTAADPWLGEPGDYTDGTFGYLLATMLDAPVTSRAGSDSSLITVTATVATTGTITILAGDDYPATNPIALTRTWTDVNVTGYTAQFLVRSRANAGGGTAIGSATFTLADGVLTAAVVLDHDETAALIPTANSDGPFTYQYQLLLTSSDGTIRKSPFTGQLMVKRSLQN